MSESNFQILPENSDSRGTYRDDSDNYGLSQLSYLGDEANEESSLLRSNTISSISSFVPQNTLHRKPSFLGPESQYDGGGFQFLSGLSQ